MVNCDNYLFQLFFANPYRLMNDGKHESNCTIFFIIFLLEGAYAMGFLILLSIDQTQGRLLIIQVNHVTMICREFLKKQATADTKILESIVHSYSLLSNHVANRKVMNSNSLISFNLPQRLQKSGCVSKYCD